MPILKAMTEHLSMDQAFTGRLTGIILTNLRNENFSAEDLASEALKDKQLWEGPNEKEIKDGKDYFDIHREIAEAIAEELDVVITPREKQLIEKTPAVNLTVLDFCQRGKEELTNFEIGHSNIEVLKKAEDLYH
jgi:hypothetical protein